MNTNNPYHHTAARYDRHLRLPVISAIRRQEADAVGQLIARYAHRGHRALEVGAGTGFYTLPLAQAFREVVAVEDSAPMARILRERLSGRAGNVTVINADFRALPLEDEFDVEIPEADAEKIRTVGDAVHYLEAKGVTG